MSRSIDSFTVRDNNQLASRSKLDVCLLTFIDERNSFSSRGSGRRYLNATNSALAVPEAVSVVNVDTVENRSTIMQHLRDRSAVEVPTPTSVSSLTTIYHIIIAEGCVLNNI